jgi:hypothetical protein
MARLTDCPALAMSEGEAKSFLQAWQNYLRHYSVKATQKTIDLITAVGVTGFLYVPRVVAVRERRRQRSQPPVQSSPFGPARVFQFHPPSPSQPPQQAAPQPQPPAAIQPVEVPPAPLEGEPIH